MNTLSIDPIDPPRDSPSSLQVSLQENGKRSSNNRGNPGSKAVVSETLATPKRWQKRGGGRAIGLPSPPEGSSRNSRGQKAEN